CASSRALLASPTLPRMRWRATATIERQARFAAGDSGGGSRRFRSRTVRFSGRGARRNRQSEGKTGRATRSAPFRREMPQPLTCHSAAAPYIGRAKGWVSHAMHGDQPNGNPWMKSLLIWGGIFLALLMVVSMFGPRGDAAGSIRYSDFRAKVAEGSVADVQI